MMHKHKLILASGILWTGAGIMLLTIFFKWLNLLTARQIMWALIIGIPIGLIKSKLFWNLSRANIERILKLPERTHLLNFQRPAAYALIGFMMAFGITMRTTGYIPKKYLAPIYLGIGLALFISSFIYYIQYFKLINAE